MRALYCYARLVDELGDAYDGDRLEALDELEREVGLTFDGEPTWPVMRNVQPTVREFDLPREPFLRLIEANRIDQRVADYETWAALKEYCVHSADPCGRLVLGVLRRLDDDELVAASDSVCTGLQLVNFLQDVPRDLELGRVYLPADDRRRFGDPQLDRPSDELRALLRFEADARSVAAARRASRCARGSAAGSAVPSGSSRAAGSPPSKRSRTRGWDIFTQRPKPSRARLAREAALDAGAMSTSRSTRRMPRFSASRGSGRRTSPTGSWCLPAEKRRAIAAVYAFAREVDDIADGDLPLDEKRARLEALRATLDDEAPVGPMAVALADARARFDIPAHALAALVDGGLQDTEQSRYASFDDLRGYCEKVAGAVGVACVAVYGSDDVDRARTLGIALQLINIMRDVAEDWELGRVYLPQDELAVLRRDGRRHRARSGDAGVAVADGVPGGSCARAPRRGIEAARLARPAQRALRVDVRRPLQRPARPHRGERLRRLRSVVPAVDAGEARRRRAEGLVR